MNLNSVHLNGLRAAETAARCGSLAKAAEELGVSPSAVSQQIGRIELQIGRKLFERTGGGLVPTAGPKPGTAGGVARAGCRSSTAPAP